MFPGKFLIPSGEIGELLGAGSSWPFFVGGAILAEFCKCDFVDFFPFGSSNPIEVSFPGGMGSETTKNGTDFCEVKPTNPVFFVCRGKNAGIYIS